MAGVGAAAEHAERALDFCDRALDHLQSDEPNVGEAIPLVEGIRNELLALQPSSASGGPDGIAAVGDATRAD
jgi:hypothetical protein